jgi:hypothetical protein
LATLFKKSWIATVNGPGCFSKKEEQPMDGASVAVVGVGVGAARQAASAFVPFFMNYSALSHKHLLAHHGLSKTHTTFPAMTDCQIQFHSTQFQVNRHGCC